MGEIIRANPEQRFHIITTLPVKREAIHEPNIQVITNSIKALEENENVTISAMKDIEPEGIEANTLMQVQQSK